MKQTENIYPAEVYASKEGFAAMSPGSIYASGVVTITKKNDGDVKYVHEDTAADVAVNFVVWFCSFYDIRGDHSEHTLLDAAEKDFCMFRQHRLNTLTTAPNE